MECSTHSHVKETLCPKTNGRHDWGIKWDVLPRGMKWGNNRIGIPVYCLYGCGAYATEWYKFEEIIEGE